MEYPYLTHVPDALDLITLHPMNILMSRRALNRARMWDRIEESERNQPKSESAKTDDPDESL